MNILIVSQYFWPENFRVNDLASALAENGHRVTVLTGIPNYPEGTAFPDYLKRPDHFARLGAVEIVRIPMVLRGSGSLRLALNYATFALSASTFGAWKLRGRKFDAVIGIALSPITAVIPAIVQKRLKSAPLATWVFDLWPESLAAVGITRNELVLRSVGKMVSWIYQSSEIILAQSRSFLEHARNYAPETPAVYLPSWSEEIFEQHPEPATLGPGFNIVFAGNIGDAQDFPAILRAIKALPSDANIHLWVAGDGRAATWLEGQVAAQGLSESVSLLGRRPLDEMPSLFASADALLVTLRDDPNLSMTIPGKVQSYLAAARPVLAMMNGEGQQAIVESGAGLVASAGDHETLSHLILTMAAMEREERTQLGRNGRSYYDANFSRSAVVDRLILLLSDVRSQTLRQSEDSRSSTEGS